MVNAHILRLLENAGGGGGEKAFLTLGEFAFGFY